MNFYNYSGKLTIGANSLRVNYIYALTVWVSRDDSSVFGTPDRSALATHVMHVASQVYTVSIE